jgi:hypothetical protein
MGEKRGAYRILVGRDLREGDDLGDPSVDGGNIKMDLREVGCGHELD